MIINNNSNCDSDKKYILHSLIIADGHIEPAAVCLKVCGFIVIPCIVDEGMFLQQNSHKKPYLNNKTTCSYYVHAVVKSFIITLLSIFDLAPSHQLFIVLSVISQETFHSPINNFSTNANTV
jgi:hypothetical protein